MGRRMVLLRDASQTLSSTRAEGMASNCSTASKVCSPVIFEPPYPVSRSLRLVIE